MDNLLEQLTGLRQTLYSHLLVCYKGYSSGTAKWKRRTGQGMGWESGTLPFPTPPGVQQPGRSPNSELGFFWRSHYGLVINSTSSPPSPHLQAGGGAEGSNPLAPPGSSWLPAPILKLSNGLPANTHLISIPKTHNHTGNFKCFRNSVPGSRDKDRIYISY